tara:strand:- start:627 stop:1052 length:426 start_codon:yes stop_codon:yes gene_type:complete
MIQQQESTNKTWFIDIDGTLVYHQTDENLDRVIEELGAESHIVEKPIEESVSFINDIPPDDTIIITTARDSKHKDHTLRMLNHFNIRYDDVLFDLRSGPRVVVNDVKPIGAAGNDKPMKTAYAINVERDAGVSPSKASLAL